MTIQLIWLLPFALPIAVVALVKALASLAGAKLDPSDTLTIAILLSIFLGLGYTVALYRSENMLTVHIPAPSISFAAQP